MKRGENLRGKGFESRPEDINRKGRPKKIYNVLIEKGYSAADIKTAFGEMAWYSLAELQKVHTDEKMPIIARIVANQFYLALQKGDWTKIREILEHTVGKPSQTINANIGTQKADLAAIFPTEDELEDDDQDQDQDQDESQ